MGVNFCDKLFTIHIKSLYCTPKTNTIFYVNCISIKLVGGGEKKTSGKWYILFLCIFISWGYSFVINIKKKKIPTTKYLSLRDKQLWPGWMTFSLRSDFFFPSNHIFSVVKLKTWSTPCLLSHNGVEWTPRLSQEVIGCCSWCSCQGSVSTYVKWGGWILYILRALKQ